MKRFVDYRTLNEEDGFIGPKVWTREKLTIETQNFQNLIDVIYTLRKWYLELDIIKIENLDFKELEMKQIQAIYDEEEERGRHDPVNEEMPF